MSAINLRFPDLMMCPVYSTLVVNNLLFYLECDICMFLTCLPIVDVVDMVLGCARVDDYIVEVEEACLPFIIIECIVEDSLKKRVDV